MISIPSAILDDLKRVFTGLQGKKSVISQSELISIINNNGGDYPSIYNWLNLYSDGTKKRYISIAVKTLEIPFYRKPGKGHGSQPVWIIPPDPDQNSLKEVGQ
jgi:hypothetical protein